MKNSERDLKHGEHITVDGETYFSAYHALLEGDVAHDLDDPDRTAGHRPEFGPKEPYGPDEEGENKQASSNYSEDPALGLEDRVPLSGCRSLLSADDTKEQKRS